MATTLRDFLKANAASFKVDAQKNKVMIEEWQVAVKKLFTQLEEWLVAADPQGVIEPTFSQIVVSQPGLGRYQISRLDLQAFGKWVGLIPKARRTVMQASPQQSSVPERATGRVDITDEIRRYLLLRFPQNGVDEWFIDDLATNSGVQPLTPERFEAALLSYFL